MASRGELIEKAKLAEQAERYQDMVDFMGQVVSMEPVLAVEERNLFSVAYKNVVGARRSAWRILSSIDEKAAAKGEEVEKNLVKEYKETIAKEIEDICSKVLEALDALISGCESFTDTNPESKVFYHKMKGDYYRYLVEVSAGGDRDEIVGKSRAAYDQAVEEYSGLPPTHPIRLGVDLNFSVFYYEILNDSTGACKLAKESFDKAIAELDNLKEDAYKDSTLIMQLLRDNLTLWTSESQEPEAQ